MSQGASNKQPEHQQPSSKIQRSSTVQAYLASFSKVLEDDSDKSDIHQDLITSDNFTSFLSDEDRAESILELQAKNLEFENSTDVERWIRSNHSSPCSSRMGMLGNVDKYLSQGALSFSEKDDSDIELPDPLLNQLQQNEKLLMPCDIDKDEFILPEFQLDNLEDYCSDEAMILRECNRSPSLDNSTDVNSRNLVENAQEQDSENRNFCDKETSTEYGNNLEITTKNNLIISSLMNINNLPIIKSECLTETENKSHKSKILESKDQVKSDIGYLNTKFEPNKIILMEYNTARQAKVLIGNETNGTINEHNGKKFVFLKILSRNEQNLENIEVASKKSENKAQKKKKKQSLSSKPEKAKKDDLRENIVYTPQELAITKALELVGIKDDDLLQTVIDDYKCWQCFQSNCKQQFSKLCSFKAHLLTHFGVKPFKCDQEGCSWAFYSEFKLKRHKETHLKRKDFVCSIQNCKRRFTTIYNLASHEKLHTRPNRIHCQAPDCTAKFQTKRALELHMKSHDSSLAPYVCNFEGCGKRYYGSNALTSHQRCHSYTEQDVTCMWAGCGKVFDQPCRLKAHMRSHTGLKPYACTFKGCKWAFTSSSKLKRHQKKHTNDRRFVCSESSCGKKFMRSEHLKEHMLTHTEQRAFQCNECSSTFSARSSLYVHIKKHNKNLHASDKSVVHNKKKRNSKTFDYSKKNVKSANEFTEISLNHKNNNFYKELKNQRSNLVFPLASGDKLLEKIPNNKDSCLIKNYNVDCQSDEPTSEHLQKKNHQNLLDCPSNTSISFTESANNNLNIESPLITHSYAMRQVNFENNRSNDRTYRSARTSYTCSQVFSLKSHQINNNNNSFNNNNSDSYDIPDPSDTVDEVYEENVLIDDELSSCLNTVADDSDSDYQILYIDPKLTDHSVK